MKSLTDLHLLLDKSEFDHTHLDEIKQLYVDLLSSLDYVTNAETFRLADLEWQALNIRKSFDYKLSLEEGILDGLSWQMAGTKTSKEGVEMPHYWPNLLALADEDFFYFEEVWQHSKNNFIKVEFGLLVYFGSKTPYSKSQQFSKELFSICMNLILNYESKFENQHKYKSYYAYFIHALKLLTGIVFRSKLKEESQQLANYLIKAHDNIIFFEKGLQSIYTEITNLIATHYTHFKILVSLENVIQLNLSYINHLKGYNLWGAISLINPSISILEKQGKNFKHLLLEKAIVYEKLADDASKHNPSAESSFIVDAMKNYKSADDMEGYARMQERYSSQRGKIQLTDFELEISADDIQAIQEKIRLAVLGGDSKELINMLTATPWYSNYDVVKKHATEMRLETPLLSILPVSVMDKFGNIIARFSKPDELLKYEVLRSYNTNIQMGTYVMVNFVLKAIESKKIDYESVMHHLSTTWINDAIPFLSQNTEINIVPIHTLKPVIKRFFIEMNHHLKGNSDEIDIVTLTDSMTLRIEQLLRQFCLKAGIFTFKRKKGNDDIMMEKTLDELLAELENDPELIPGKTVNFNEDHRQLIKFVMTEKGGWNLRNEIAHGLMDFPEYTIEKPIVLLSIILKLSGYQFIENKKENGHDC